MNIVEQFLTIVALLVAIRYTWFKGTELKLKNEITKLEIKNRRRRK